MNRSKQSNKLYTMSHMLDQLSSKGIAVTSKPTYIKYEKMGVFKQGKFTVLYKNRTERIFTKEEMAENIARFKAYKSGSLQ